MKNKQSILGKEREGDDEVRWHDIDKNKTKQIRKKSEHITFVKGRVKARSGYTEVWGEPEEHVLSSGVDGSRDLSATENC